MASVNPTEAYDYIVCGGGTSGCVVAGRLAEDPNVRVLLLEAGAHNKDLENTQMVGGWSQNFDTPADWNIASIPRPEVANRSVKLSRGRFLGGCSGCNGTLCIRGCRQDYDDWHQPGWSGDEFFEAMKKSETFHSKPWFKEDPSAHGYSGPLHIEPHDPAPISNLLIESLVDKGLPYDCDMFSTGATPHGCGHVPRTVYKGIRTTGADFVAGPYKIAGSNLDIRTGATVDKVLLEREGDDLVARGVQIVTDDGKTETFKAKREVIVSAGAYCSPAVLMRSGLGPKEELERHGIQVQKDIHGVGKNLMDHLIVFAFYELEPNSAPATTEAEKAGEQQALAQSQPHEYLTNDHHVYLPGAFERTYQAWKEHKTGFLSTFPFGCFAFARLDERLRDSDIWNNAPREAGRDPMGLTPAQPNIEYFSTECYGGPKQYDRFPTNGEQVFSIISELFAPKSRGRITLASADARANPVVDLAWLSDERGLDLEVLAEACRWANEIVLEGKGTRGRVKGCWPRESGHDKFKTRDDWKPYVREHATTCYHAAGTTRMPRPHQTLETDPDAVVDARLRVRGVRGLRVVDTSVMPTLHGGHTQMPAYGIGERAADFIKEDWQKLAGGSGGVKEKVEGKVQGIIRGLEGVKVAA